MISDEDKIIDKGFERCDGPFVKALDSALASFNVERQAYYSGTFIGNHVHRCLQVCIVPHMYSSIIHNVAFKPRYIDTVCTAVVETAEKLAPSLVSTAEDISRQFTQLFSLFAKCHNTYNGGGKLSDQKINQLG